jgi:type IV secretion system protein VirB6
MFFDVFFNWLNAQLIAYIGSTTASVARAIEPAVVTMGWIYVMLWGYFMFTGQIREPIIDGFKRIVTIALIFGIGLQLWAYNTLIVDTFFVAPEQLANAVGGSTTTTVGVIDGLWADGARAAGALWDRAGVLDGNFGFYFVALVMYGAVGLLSVFVGATLAIAKIMVALALSLGPVFIALLLFKPTQRFFGKWVGTMTNYALVVILIVLAARLLLQFVTGYAGQLARLGGSIQLVDTLDLIVGCVLLAIVMRQIPQMAASLSEGISISTASVVGASVNWGLSRTGRTSLGVWDALSGGKSHRYDPLARKMGYWAVQGPRAMGQALWRLARPNNSIRRR